MTITAHSPRWANAGHTAIDLVVQFDHLPDEVPFTASAGDTEEHGRALFAAAQAGEFGTVADFETPVATVADYIHALDAHLNAAARAKGYDDIHSAALRAGYPGPFHNEGLAFATWMDGCYAAGYQVLADFKAGVIAQPSVSAFLAGLPDLSLP